ncbi:MAG: fibronectin type III domain-containing protein, partial [Planctomycetota bacterium]
GSSGFGNWSQAASGVSLDISNVRYVRYRVDLGTGPANATSVLNDITVTVLPAAQPAYPADSSYVNLSSVNLSWLQADTTVYPSLTGTQVQFDDASDFATPLADATTGPATRQAYELGLALAHGTTYYWRVRPDPGGVWSSTQSFVVDLASPSASGFQSFNSIGGVRTEAQFNGLTSGVTVQMTVQDALAGLAVTTGTIASGGFGVMYSTTAGQSWIDGNWAAANANSAVISGETYVKSLAAYNGKLYAGTGVGGKVAVFDGTNWAETNGNSAIIPGVPEVLSLVAYNGKLYAGTNPGGKVAVFDGTNWAATNANSAVISGAIRVDSLAAYNGKLYAGTYPGGKVAELTPVAASLAGSDGTTAALTLQTTGLNLVQSTNTETCGGVYPCGATNQVKFTVTDMAGNVRTAGPYAVLVDTCTGPLSFAFTDPGVLTSTHTLRAVYITDLRGAIDTLRADAGLGAYAWTDSVLTPRSSVMRAVYISELRAALGPVYTACGDSPPTYTDPALTPGVSRARAVYFNELRTAVFNAK